MARSPNFRKGKIAYSAWTRLCREERGIFVYTLSWHQEGASGVRQAHNRREGHALGRDSEIDRTRIKDNLILVDVPLRQAYDQLFGKAQEEYNVRARASRRIDDYYTHICKSGKQAAYEVIVQVGSKAEGTPQDAVDALRRYVADWSTRNTHLVCVGAYIHADEAGAVHLHLDYIPVARCSRGMRVQNSLTRALGAQGFKTRSAHDTAQMQWEQSERDRMRTICAELGIELFAQGKGRTQHYTVGEYKDRQDHICRLRAQEQQEQAFLTLTMQQQAEAQLAVTHATQRATQARQEQEQAHRQYVSTLQKMDALRKKLDVGKQELDTLQCKIFSARQDAQDIRQTVQALGAELQRIRKEYTSAYDAALQAKTIAVLRSYPDGQEWWAWAAEQAAREPDLQTYTDFVQGLEVEELEQEWETDPTR
ncbi:MAG: hypothetical protein NC489_37875 [Ruminococcus flavefaciens]|nr:hypothetical protein [Ruminococcus flavefaciens]